MEDSNRQLAVGIVGLGRLGKMHASALAFSTRNCKLVAACSPLQEERDWAAAELAAQPDFTTYSSLDAMLANPKLEAVFLVTPTALHAEQCLAVLNNNKHLFVEKPLSLDLVAGKQVADLAAQKPDLVSWVGFVRRFDPSYSEAYQYIASGKLGKPFLVFSQTCDQFDPSGFFVKFAPTSGGIFLDCSVHDIDLARWLMGKPKALRAYASGANAVHTELQQFQDVDNGVGLVDFEGGKRAVFYASRTFIMGHETRTEVIGDQGKLLIGQGGFRNKVAIGDQHGLRQEVVSNFYERFEEAFRIELQTFVRACLKQQSLPSNMADANEATRIGLALRASLIEGKPIDL